MDSSISAQKIRDRFETSALKLRHLLDKKNTRMKIIDSCVFCMCFPCIFCMRCLKCLNEKQDDESDHFIA